VDATRRLAVLTGLDEIVRRIAAAIDAEDVPRAREPACFSSRGELDDRFHETDLCMEFIWPVKRCSLSFDWFDGSTVMTASRRVVKFTIGKADLSKLASIARSRTEPVGRVERARVLLAYRQDPSFYAVGQALGMHHQKVQRYIERAKAEGALAALDERARPGKEPTITVEAKTWVVALALPEGQGAGLSA
jgi:hypothetical protein